MGNLNAIQWTWITCPIVAVAAAYLVYKFLPDVSKIGDERGMYALISMTVILLIYTSINGIYDIATSTSTGFSVAWGIGTTVALTAAIVLTYYSYERVKKVQ
ncbi:MAG TPA: hypothetical protein VN704_05815 [Verrucomicrobiae bacterium]|nr:hypothetical protein [Verrucomicrobiae bacterium]